MNRTNSNGKWDGWNDFQRGWKRRRTRAVQGAVYFRRLTNWVLTVPSLWPSPCVFLSNSRWTSSSPCDPRCVCLRQNYIQSQLKHSVYVLNINNTTRGRYTVCGLVWFTISKVHLRPGWFIMRIITTRTLYNRAVHVKWLLCDLCGTNCIDFDIGHGLANKLRFATALNEVRIFRNLHTFKKPTRT